MKSVQIRGSMMKSLMEIYKSNPDPDFWQNNAIRDHPRALIQSNEIYIDG